MKIKDSIGLQTLLIGLVVVFLYATKYQLAFNDSIEWVQATDVYEYILIATSAPDFPNVKISFHFSQRWIPHYLVGLLHYYFGLDIGVAYAAANMAVVTAILFVTLRVLLRQVEDEKFGLLLFFILAMSAFSFRLAIFVPGLLADLVYVLGLALSLLGLQSRSMAKILCGVVISMAGKQFAIISLPGLGLYTFIVFLGAYGMIRASIYVVLTCVVNIGFYFFLLFTSANFSVSNTMTIGVLISFIPWLFSDHFSIRLLLEHLIRIFIPLVPFLLILLITPKSIDGLSKNTVKLCTFKFFELLANCLLIAGPLVYALLPGPMVQMGNQSRYVATAMLPMALLTIIVLPKFRVRFQWVDIIALSGVLMALSYHHRYTFVQATPIALLVTQMLGLVGLAAWLLLRRSVFIRE